MNRRGFLTSLLALPVAMKAIDWAPQPDVRIVWWGSASWSPQTIELSPTSADAWESFLEECFESDGKPHTFYVGQKAYEVLQRYR